MSSDNDNIILSTGKQYAYGKIVGMSLDPDDSIIYTGFDNEMGEFKEGGLTRDEKAEVAWQMVARWTKFLTDLYE